MISHLFRRTKGNARVLVALRIVLIAAALYLFRDGLKEVWDLKRPNDFDVIRMGAREAWNRSTDIYIVKNIRGRHFLYPPSGALLLVPISWFPYRLAGVLFTFIRFGLLAAIIALTIRWLREQGLLIDPATVTWVIFITAIVTWRYVASEFGNGQINILLAALCVFGFRLAFCATARWQWLGGVLIAIAGAIKVTPLIFLGLFLLQKRWRSLAGGLASVLTIAILTVLWFGRDNFFHLFTEFAHNSRQMALNARTDDHVFSLHEFLVSVASRCGFQFSLANINRWWLAESLAAGVLYLVVRFALNLRGRSISPLFETCIFVLLSLYLAPKVRKAHMAHLVFPVLVATAYVVKGKIQRCAKPRLAVFWISSFLLCFGLTIPFEKLISGYYTNPLPFFGLSLFLLSLVMMNQYDRRGTITGVPPTESMPPPVFGPVK